MSEYSHGRVLTCARLPDNCSLRPGEIMLSARAGRATPGTPGSSVIMRGPGHLSHTVRVTHYVDTFWPARIMFHPQP